MEWALETEIHPEVESCLLSQTFGNIVLNLLLSLLKGEFKKKLWQPAFLGC
jgi:hypothetical protein